jgi:hypothetical protein
MVLVPKSQHIHRLQWSNCGKASVGQALGHQQIRHVSQAKADALERDFLENVCQAAGFQVHML